MRQVNQIEMYLFHQSCVTPSLSLFFLFLKCIFPVIKFIFMKFTCFCQPLSYKLFQFVFYVVPVRIICSFCFIQFLTRCCVLSNSFSNYVILCFSQMLFKLFQFVFIRFLFKLFTIYILYCFCLNCFRCVLYSSFFRLLQFVFYKVPV